jgi:hypothetical protein
MTESESVAVPLGDTPTYHQTTKQVAGVPGLEPGEWRDQNPLPYHLAIPLHQVSTVFVIDNVEYYK